MIRGGPFIFLMLAMLIVVISGVLIWGFVNQSRTEALPPPKPVDWVVVAKADLAWGTTLNENVLMLRTKEELLKQNILSSSDELPPDRFATVESLMGRVLAINLQSQMPILESHLAPRGVRPGVDAILDPEKRAMAVKVDQEVAVAGFIMPGHRVDVLVTMQASEGGAQTISKMVIENVRVLASGTQMQILGEEGKAQPVSIMTLEVTPHEAEKLTFASTRGRLRLVLRSSLNPDEVLTRGATTQSVLRSYRLNSGETAPKPKKRIVEVIKGSSSSKHKF